MTPMNETTDRAYYDGWHDGYKHAINDIRQKLLALQHEDGKKLPIEVYVELNRLEKE